MEGAARCSDPSLGMTKGLQTCNGSLGGDRNLKVRNISLRARAIRRGESEGFKYPKS